LWQFRATGAEDADSASSRPRICAATQRVYVAAPDGVAGVSVGFEWGAAPSASQNSPDPGALRPLGHQSAGRDVEHRLPVPRATSTRCRLGGKCPQHTSRPEKRPTCPWLAADLIDSQVRGSARYPKASQVTDIVGSRIGLDMSSGACSFVGGSRCPRAIGRPKCGTEQSDRAMSVLAHEPRKAALRTQLHGFLHRAAAAKPVVPL